MPKAPSVTKQTSFIPKDKKDFQWTGPFYSPNAHEGCSGVQLKLCPENFVELTITPLLESVMVPGG